MLKVSLNSFKKIAVTGPEAGEWLNRVLTNSPDPSKDSEVFAAAILDYRGRPESLFFVCKNSPTDYLLLCEASTFEQSMQKLDMGIFGEDLELKEDSSQGHLYLEIEDGAFAGPMDQSEFRNFLRLSDKAEGHVDSEAFYEALNYYGFVPLKDLENRVLIESAVYNAYIHHDKGCYPGQEVINKIISMGKPPKFLMRIEHEALQDMNEIAIDAIQENFSLGSNQYSGKYYCNVFVKNKFLKSLESLTKIDINVDSKPLKADIKIWELKC